MEPSLCAGDALLVDRSQIAVMEGKVYVLRYGDEVRVKRLFKRPDGGLKIISDNRAFPAIDVPVHELAGVEIIGRVIHRAGDL